MKPRTFIGVISGAIFVAGLIFLGYQGVRYLWVFTSPTGRAFLQALYNLRENHLSQPNPDALLSAGIAGMVERLNDPFSEYIPPLDQRGSPSLFVNGVGEVGLRIKAANPDGTGSRIVAVRSISPAADAGIRPGDLLSQVDDLKTASMNPLDIAKRLLGARGSVCTVVIQRGATTRRFKLIRDDVYAKTVAAFTLEADIGYVRISDFFNAATAEQFKRALQTLRSSGAKRLVLDLRDNGGGRIDQALAVADALLSQGVIFAVRDRAGRVSSERQATKSTDDDARPLVVLVNHGTASASEILAAALQGNDRARLIGEPTLGKGVANAEVNLVDGSKLILTNAEWLTPKGQNLRGRGLEPDLRVADTRFPSPMTVNAQRLPRDALVTITANGQTVRLRANARGEVSYSSAVSWASWGLPRDAASLTRDAQIRAAVSALRVASRR